MSNRSSYWSHAAVALLVWCTTVPYATLVSAAAAPTYYGTGITVRYHNGLRLDFHHLPPIRVGTHFDLGCQIKASGRSNPGWSIAINANGHPLLVRRSTARDIRVSRGGVYSIHVSNWMVTLPGRNSVSCQLSINGSNSELIAPALAFNATGTVPHPVPSTTNVKSSPATSNWNSSPAGSSSFNRSSSPPAPAAPRAAAPSYYGTGITVRYHNGLGLDFHHLPPIRVGTHFDLGCQIKASGRSNPGWSIAINANGHPLLVRRSTARDIRVSRGGVYSIHVSNWMVTLPGRNSVSCQLSINGSGSQLLAPALAFNATGTVPHPVSSTTNVKSSPATSNWNSSPAGSSSSNGNSAPHTKACKSALTADVELQPNQLGTPVWQPEAAGVQAPQIVLPLQSSASAGNSVTCTYASVHGDVTLTTKLDCRNAQKGSGRNAYSCE